MNEKMFYWGSLLVSAVALVLLVINISVISGNRAIQAEVNQRQAMINEGSRYAQLNQVLLQAIAEGAVKNQNANLKGLLASQGFTLRETPEKPTSSSKEAPKSSDKR